MPIKKICLKEDMNPYWKSKKPIKGLFHFVIINEFEDNGEIFLLLVSALDADINLVVSRKSLKKSEDWVSGWQESNSSDQITNEYKIFKSRREILENKKIFLNETSLFNIS
tara:strand:+ start:1084 stop:1416 length:333 start_codon:yes stop_codon:yes gene_type:complete